MKKIFILFLFISSILNAQNKEYKHSLSGIKKVQIESNTKIKIIAGNTSQLVLKNKEDKENHYSSHHDHWDDKKKEEKKNKRKGLTPIYPGGRDNTNGFGFSITKEGDVLYVKDLRSHFQRHGLEIMLPKNINIMVDSGNLGSIYLEGFTAEVEADTNVGSINMKNVTGPITAHTSVGAINIDFDKVSQVSPITISSSVSEIDVAIPANTNANLDLKTNGTVYTNFDITIPTKKGMKNVGGNKRIISNLNKGGVKIKIQSSMGNIYLRKK